MFGFVLTAFLFVACGGGSTATEVPVTSPTQAPTSTSAPAPQSTDEPTATPLAPGRDEATLTTVADYVWDIETVDNNAAKPSLAVDSNGVPPSPICWRPCPAL